MMQSNSWIDRRALLTGGLGAFASMLLDRGVDLRAEPAPVRVRREVHEPAAAPMLALYKRAIKEMKTRPVWDPTSWWFQANIHLLPPENDFARLLSRGVLRPAVSAPERGRAGGRRAHPGGAKARRGRGSDRSQSWRRT